ncbi:glycosyltransferase [Lysinibacter cavernae]|uniref:D-inositol 3-phosphate glycosyltransferase n=1 Tax=Lysinibacter cavernae TaxID=1640652 RepID=A0A7X5R333_9MICO|nr:glycosyltransferase [Lysinibacter cavernae]NIH54627.1 D-inositol-3-phosphate glycosyltransferase [Lysinibacter cavernae]
MSANSSQPVPLRVALISSHTSPLSIPGQGDAGGLNVQVLSLAVELVRMGHSVDIITRRTHREQPAVEVTAEGITVRALTAGPLAPVPKEDLPAVLTHMSERIAELGPYDIYHSHYWLSGVAALPVAESLNAPHILNLHTVAALKNQHLAPGDRPEPQSRIDAERSISERSELITGSERERHSLISDYHLQPARVHHISPGVDTALFRPALPRHPALLDAGPYVVTLGRVQPLKGQDLAVEILAALPKSVRPLLVIAGEPTPGNEAYAESLRGLAARLGVTDSVRFLPAQTREHAAQLLSGAELAIVPSHSETFGLVALEAAAAGTPVLAQRITGLAESVVSGVTGILFEGREPSVWAEKIASLLNDEASLVSLSTSARTAAESRSWPRHARRVSDVYLAALNR